MCGLRGKRRQHDELGRLATWKYAAVPSGERRGWTRTSSRSILRVRDLYKKEGGKVPDLILNLNWAYAGCLFPAFAVAMELELQKHSPT